MLRRYSLLCASITALLFILAAVPMFANGQKESSSSSSGPVTLTYMDYWAADPANSAMKAYIAKFEAANPNLKIERTSVPFGNLLPKALQEASSHSLPDILMLDNPQLQDFASTGALAPLDSFTTIDKSQYFPGPLSTVTYNGKLYGLPVGNNDLAIFYNKTMFKQANLTPPKTWDELLADAKALTSGNTYGFAFSAPTTEEATWQFEPFLWTAQGDLQTIGDPQAISALNLWVTMINNGWASKSVINWSQNDVEKQFELGHAAMMENGPWNLPLLRKSTVDYGIVPIPVPKAGMVPVAPLGGEVFTIPVSNVSREKEAWKFVQMLQVPENLVAVNKAMGYIPAYIPAAKQLVAEDPQLQVFMDELKTGRARTNILGQNYPKVSEIVWNAIQSALVGTATPEAAFKQAQQQVNQALGK